MAVTITSADLIQPLGKLEPNFFPDADLDSKIGGWFNQAKTKVEANTNIKGENQDEATRQYSYYLAFDYIAGRFASMPNSASVNKGADEVAYGQDRPPYWRARAAEALAAYGGLFTVITKQESRNSIAVPVQVVL